MASEKTLVSIKLETRRFRKALQKKIRSMNIKDTQEFLDEVGMAIIEGVVPKTPVRSGRARSGWSSAARALGAKVSVPPAKKQIYYIDGTFYSANEMQEMGKSEGFFRKGKRYREIVNAVPYIVELEGGRSSQSPGGMLRETMREMRTSWSRKLGKKGKKMLRRGWAK